MSDSIKLVSSGHLSSTIAGASSTRYTFHLSLAAYISAICCCTQNGGW